MKIFDWLLGRKYLDWGEYKEKLDTMEDEYWKEQSEKSRYSESK